MRFTMLRNDFRTHGLLLTSSKDEVIVHGSPDNFHTIHQYKWNGQWETLELYLVSISDLLQFLVHYFQLFCTLFDVKEMINEKGLS